MCRSLNCRPYTSSPVTQAAGTPASRGRVSIRIASSGVEMSEQDGLTALAAAVQAAANVAEAGRIVDAAESLRTPADR